MQLASPPDKEQMQVTGSNVIITFTSIIARAITILSYETAELIIDLLTLKLGSYITKHHGK